MHLAIATLNAKSIFTRLSVMRFCALAEGEGGLEDYATVSSLIEADTYTAALLLALVWAIARSNTSWAAAD